MIRRNWWGVVVLSPSRAEDRCTPISSVAKASLSELPGLYPLTAQTGTSYTGWRGTGDETARASRSTLSKADRFGSCRAASVTGIAVPMRKARGA